MTRLRDLDVAWFERERDPFLTHDFVAGYYHYLDLLEHAVTALRELRELAITQHDLSPEGKMTERDWRYDVLRLTGGEG